MEEHFLNDAFPAMRERLGYAYKSKLHRQGNLLSGKWVVAYAGLTRVAPNFAAAKALQSALDDLQQAGGKPADIEAMLSEWHF